MVGEASSCLEAAGTSGVRLVGGGERWRAAGRTTCTPDLRLLRQPVLAGVCRGVCTSIPPTKVHFNPLSIKVASLLGLFYCSNISEIPTLG